MKSFIFFLAVFSSQMALAAPNVLCYLFYQKREGWKSIENQETAYILATLNGSSTGIKGYTLEAQLETIAPKNISDADSNTTQKEPPYELYLSLFKGDALSTTRVVIDKKPGTQYSISLSVGRDQNHPAGKETAFAMCSVYNDEETRKLLDNK